MRPFATVIRLTVFSILIFANSQALFGQTDSIYRLPAGTRIYLKMDTEINSKVASVNDTFLASVSRPVAIRDMIVLPVGTVVEGRVSGVSRSAGGGQGGRLEVVFETLRFAKATRQIDAVMVTRIGSGSSRTFNILSILGGIAAGAAIGATGSNSGALIGAGVGAGAGTGLVLLRKGKDVKMRKGGEFEIELKKEVVLPVLDY